MTSQGLMNEGLMMIRWRATGGVTRELKKLEEARKAKDDAENAARRHYN